MTSLFWDYVLRNAYNLHRKGVMLMKIITYLTF